jgi:SHS2 domain-containing protein
MTDQPSAFEEIEHTADVSLRIYGRDLSDLLRHAAEGMAGLLVVDPSVIPVTQEEHFDLEAYDTESLLVNWLSELAYWAESEGVVFSQFDLFQVTSTRLQAVARGGRVSNLHKYIKAVTYHNLKIIEIAEGLETTVVFDV